MAQCCTTGQTWLAQALTPTMLSIGIASYAGIKWLIPGRNPKQSSLEAHHTHKGTKGNNNQEDAAYNTPYHHGLLGRFITFAPSWRTKYRTMYIHTPVY